MVFNTYSLEGISRKFAYNNAYKGSPIKRVDCILVAQSGIETRHTRATP